MQPESLTPKDLHDGFVVAITIEAKPGEADRMASILQDLVAPTMAEPGVKLFLPYRSPTNPLLFFVFELYVDEAAWSVHQDTSHFKKAVKYIVPNAARRERVPFVPYEAIAG